MKLFKSLVSLGLLVVGLTMASAAHAGITPQSTTIGDWQQGAVTIGDKVFTMVDTDLDPGLLVDFTVVGGEYSVAVSFGSGQTGVFSASLHYTVAITNPLLHFTGVRLDTTHAGTGVQVIKSEATGKFPGLISNDGNPASSGIGGNQMTLDVTDAISVGIDGAIISMTNGFLQGGDTVPEPSTLAILLGLGSLGLVVRARRNAKNA